MSYTDILKFKYTNRFLKKNLSCLTLVFLNQWMYLHMQFGLLPHSTEKLLCQQQWFLEFSPNFLCSTFFLFLILLDLGKLERNGDWVFKHSFTCMIFFAFSTTTKVVDLDFKIIALLASEERSAFSYHILNNASNILSPTSFGSFEYRYGTDLPSTKLKFNSGRFSLSAIILNPSFPKSKLQ